MGAGPWKTSGRYNLVALGAGGGHVCVFGEGFGVFLLKGRPGSSHLTAVRFRLSLIQTIMDASEKEMPCSCTTLLFGVDYEIKSGEYCFQGTLFIFM